MKFIERGLKIKLFPRDTYWKKAIIRDVDDHGILIEIDDCHTKSGYKKGEIHFFNWNGLKFQLHITSRQTDFRGTKIGDECMWCYEIIRSEDHYCQ